MLLVLDVIFLEIASDVWGQNGIRSLKYSKIIFYSIIIIIHKIYTIGNEYK